VDIDLKPEVPGNNSSQRLNFNTVESQFYMQGLRKVWM